MNKNLFCWSEDVFNMCKYFVGKLSKEKTIAVKHIGSLGLSVEVVVHMLNAQPELCLYPGLPAGRKEYPFCLFCLFPMMVYYLCCTMKSGKNMGNYDFLESLRFI